MADRSFGVKDIDLIGASGTPTIESPNNLNINAVNVAISTDITVGGMVSLGAGTSISSPAANTLTLGTNSVERVRIDSSGNIGIGTDNPTVPLEVQADNLPVTIRRNSDAGDLIYLRNNNFYNVIGGDGGSLYFKTNGTAFGDERLRITSSGNIGIGTTNPNAKLEVRDGKIRAGEDQATIGGTILEGRYSDGGDILNILGSHHSNGATVLSYGMRPKTNSSGYVSSFANFSGGRAALEMWGDGAQIVTAPSQNTAIGSDLTNVAGAVMVRNNGDVTMRGTDSQYIEIASFRTTNGNTSTTGLVDANGGLLSFTPIQNTNASVIVHSTVTNPTRITFPVNGVVHINFHQDIRSGNATIPSHYDHIKVKRNGTNYLNSLITSTNSLWDNIHGTATIEVSANDYIELELATNTSIVGWDDAGWSSYNFMFAPINTNR